MMNERARTGLTSEEKHKVEWAAAGRVVFYL